MILITGASGNVGREVLKAVLHSGTRVRAMYRSPKDAAQAPAPAEAVIADFSDRDSLRRALEGVDRVFLVCAPIPQLVEYEANVVEVCRELGVGRILYHSALGAGQYDRSFPKWHGEVEELIRESGITYTSVRPESFMQNIVAFFAPTIRTQNAFYSSMGTSRAAFIDIADIAAVCAAILTGGGHDSQIYELMGPEALSYSEVAAKISKVTGRAINYVDLPMEVSQKSMLDTGMPAWLVEALLDLQRYYVSGMAPAPNGNVRKILGRDPSSLDAFLARNAAQFST